MLKFTDSCMCVYTEAFAMTKQHKDIAMNLMESVQDEELSDQGTIKVNKVVAECVGV